MKLLVLGASSAIAQAMVRHRLRECPPEQLVLAARNPGALLALAEEARDRGVEVSLLPVEATDGSGPDDLYHTLQAADVQPDTILLAWGVMLDETDSSARNAMAVINHLGSSNWLRALAEKLAAAGQPVRFMVIGSVAGDRLRSSNWHYGASKQQLAEAVESLRENFRWAGHSWLLIKPGPVRTPMTQGMHLPLATIPEVVARDAWHALELGQPVCYTPRHWRYIMRLLCALPEFLWRILFLRGSP